MRPRVVIIDPDAEMRGSLCSLMANLSVDIEAHESAEQYLAQPTNGKGRKAACLVVDVTLPGMSGLKLLQHIRAVDREIPIVLLATEAEIPMAVEAMRHGATDFIEKGQMDIVLLRRVSQLLRNASPREARDAKPIAH